MSCLVYCICPHPGPQPSGSLRGVGGKPVYQVAHRCLSATFSRIGPADLTPDLPRLRAFARVVHSYHQQGPIIPLRYGCTVPQESQLVDFFDQHYLHYEALLKDLEGCVEMGVRILLPTAALGGVSSGSPQSCQEIAKSANLLAPSRLGLAYLTARKAHYARQDRWTREYRQAEERCLAHFQGLFVKAKIEGPSPRLPLLSLYFLVPTSRVEAFRQAFRRLTETQSARLLLSGPWPPYNFVTQGPRLFGNEKKEFLRGC